MAIASPAVPGAAEAVKQSGRTDVKVTGLGLPNASQALPQGRRARLRRPVEHDGPRATSPSTSRHALAKGTLKPGPAARRRAVWAAMTVRGRQRAARHAVHVHEGQRRPVRLLDGVSVATSRRSIRCPSETEYPLSIQDGASVLMTGEPWNNLYLVIRCPLSIIRKASPWSSPCASLAPAPRSRTGDRAPAHRG